MLIQKQGGQVPEDPVEDESSAGASPSSLSKLLAEDDARKNHSPQQDRTETEAQAEAKRKREQEEQAVQRAKAEAQAQAKAAEAKAKAEEEKAAQAAAAAAAKKDRTRVRIKEAEETQPVVESGSVGATNARTEEGDTEEATEEEKQAAIAKLSLDHSSTRRCETGYSRHLQRVAVSLATATVGTQKGKGRAKGAEGGRDAFLVGDTRKLVHTWAIPSSVGCENDGMGEGMGEGRSGGGARYRYFRLRSEGPIAVRGFELFGRLVRE
eukprot:g1564.t1